MKDLEELSEAGVAVAEQCVRDSMLLDYAYLADQEAKRRGQPATRLLDFINKRYEELAADGDDSGDGADT